MADLPPRFKADLEDSLRADLSANQATQAAQATQATPSTCQTPKVRRWDDPPEEEPAAPPENITTMVFVKAGTIRAAPAELTTLTFTPTDSHIVTTARRPVSGVTRAGSFSLVQYSPLTLAVWSATTGQRVFMPYPEGNSIFSTDYPSEGVCIEEGDSTFRGFAFRGPLPAASSSSSSSSGGSGDGMKDSPLIVACPFLRAQSVSAGDWMGTRMARLEVYDLARARGSRLLKMDSPLRAPVAWSPDGTLLAGVSVRDPSRVVTVVVGPNTGSSKSAKEPLAGALGSVVLMGHTDEVTHLAFLPVRRGSGKGKGAVALAAEESGRALVSVGRDGYVRVTDVVSGRTLRRIEIGGRAHASILQVSHDGRFVVTVWGRDVVVWDQDSGSVHSYNLNAVRQVEGWPLCVSPDCRYMAYRTDDGFEVCDVLTGQFRGEFPCKGTAIMSAAFNSNGTRLAVGDSGGWLQMFEVITQ
ncbi:uncharacterized protein THITE_2106496 [Thermothielavioides terrestris NRRL 8126]|uniref:Anaphase-promoting complex subunit 4 WD40 domain-containing protein n=1 Tax=Thermothielavioides terrestris (strain ATCC 38088 / NRRL 8126) TaxID=578455 RepID=G2QQH7_THETT|nr:uncharacterized protein THITE_2106496 [Thermothielavioides terrestris NRRL 8126]AEO62387.1 hypothetical protein THITE_2106496 [Thermothielavioides terrestris NRRL 8126]